MRALFLLVISLLCWADLSAQVVPDSIFRDWKPDGPAGVACVVSKGHVAFIKGFGLSDVDRKLPNGQNVKYDLASNAKQFTAMCIALLEEQGKISREDLLKKYYPTLKIKDDVRIKNLLDHTSGLRDASVLATLSGKVNLKGEVKKKFNTKEYYIQCLLSENDLGYPPGNEMAYNNFNYVLLADIVEKVSHQKFSKFMDSAIFKPLGMSQTFLRESRGLQFENESVGYLWRGGNKYKRSDPLGGIVGDHNMVATVDDLVRWQLNFFDNKLGNKDPQLISKISTPSNLNNGMTSRYGYGLFNTEYKGVNVVWHGGDDGRQTSMLLCFPDHDLSVIVLANSSRYNVTERVAFQLAEVFLQGSLVEPVITKNDFDEFTFIKIDEKELRPRVGMYTRVTPQGLPQMIRINIDNGQLIETWAHSDPGPFLSAVTGSHFVGKTVTNRTISIQFDNDNSGFVYQFQKNEPVHFAKSGEVRNTLNDYRGRYKNESTSAKIRVKKKGDHLVARKGILRIPMSDFAKDQFYAYNNDALFTFVRDGKGVVTSVRADAPDFRNFWFIKK